MTEPALPADPFTDSDEARLALLAAGADFERLIRVRVFGGSPGLAAAAGDLDDGQLRWIAIAVALGLTPQRSASRRHRPSPEPRQPRYSDDAWRAIKDGLAADGLGGLLEAVCALDGPALIAFTVEPVEAAVARAEAERR